MSRGGFPGFVENDMTDSDFRALVESNLRCREDFGMDAVGLISDPYRETSLELARQLVRTFPPAEGFVISVQGTEVYVDVAEDNLMRSGMELLIFREGAEIIHPVSQDVLVRVT